MSSEEKVSGVQEAPSDRTPGADLTALTPTTAESSEAGDLLESMATAPPPAPTPGEIVSGMVLKVTESEVLVDIGLKTEAAIPLSEFLTGDGQVSVAAGDTIDVSVDHYDESSGAITVSHQRAVRRRVWTEIERAFQEQTSLRGRVLDRIKGGLTVDIGVSAFLPSSHADVRPHANLGGLIGQEIVCKIIKLNRKRNNVVVSRRLAMEEGLNQRKAELKERLAEGAELTGRVKNLTDYGAFVDLGGLDGLLHVTDISWGRVTHPSEALQVGQEVRVKVLKYDPEKERVSLGLKQLTPDPWETVPAIFHPSDRIAGRVVSVTDYGAFVEIEPGVEGLIHISEMTWSKRLRHPSKIVKVGDRVEVRILGIDPAQHRISLSLKETLPDPWASLGERYAVGTVVQGRVRNLTEFGAFVEVEDGVDGLIHLSNLSWTRNVKHPGEVLKKGQKVEAVILALDATNRRLSLGLKQLEQDPWQEFFAKTHVEDRVRGKITRKAPFGVFVQLAEGVEGLCHSSELEDGEAGKIEEGSEYEFRVIRLTPQEKKIGLSMKEAVASASEENVRAPEPVRMSTMAEALSSAGVMPIATSPPAPAKPES